MTSCISRTALKSLRLTTSGPASRAIGASLRIISCDHYHFRESSTNTPPLPPGSPPSLNTIRHNHLPPNNLPLPLQRRISPNSISSRHPAPTTSQPKRLFAEKTKHRHVPKPNKGDYDDYSLGPDDESAPPSTKKVLLLGSSGALGRALTKHLSASLGCHVLGADVANNAHHVLGEKGGLSGYVALPKEGSMADLSVVLFRGVKTHLRDLVDAKKKKKDIGEGTGGFDAIVCASGGWEGDVDFDVLLEDLEEKEASEEGGVHWDAEEEYVKQSAKVVDRMMKMNFCPVVAGSLIGEHFLSPGGLFVIIGASAALSPTPGMIGYGSAKNAAHHFLQTYALTPASIRNDTTAVGILPLMLDTPSNRAMIGEDEGDERYGTMVKPESIAKEIGEWIQNRYLRPHSGSLVKVIAKNKLDGIGGASFHLVR
ncbi:hypothetical protein ACHAXS_008434 [Conticribra weissflogii]